MPTYQVCPPRKASNTKRPKGSGYCGALRRDGTASRKAQTNARHDHRCAVWAPVTSEVKLVKVGPRNPTLAQKLVKLYDRYNN